MLKDRENAHQYRKIVQEIVHKYLELVVKITTNFKQN